MRNTAVRILGRPYRPNPHIKEYSDQELAESFIVDGRPLIRGTPEWEEREFARCAAGCSLLSFGK